MKSLTIEVVESEDRLKVWYEIFKKVFTEPVDNISYDKFLNWFRESGKDRHHLILLDGEVIGFKSMVLDKEIKAGWTFYAGMLPEYRNQGLYPEANKLINEILVKKGIQILVTECENPQLMKDPVKKDFAIRRLKTFIKKLDYHFILDASVRYLRVSPPSKKERYIEDYYLLGFSILDKSYDLKFFDRISNYDYKKLYKIQAQLEYGSIDAAAKNISYPEFMKEIDQKINDSSSILDINTLESYLDQVGTPLDNTK